MIQNDDHVIDKNTIHERMNFFIGVCDENGNPSEVTSSEIGMSN